MVVADLDFGDAGDGGHEDYGEECADVEDEELFFERVGEGQEEEDADGEEDVAADVGAGSLLVGGEVFGRLGQLDSPGILADWMPTVCLFGVWSGSVEFGLFLGIRSRVSG